MNPYVIGFSVSLLPLCYVYFSQKHSNDVYQRDNENHPNHFSYRPQDQNKISKNNQLLMQSIFNSRHETDLYTALGEKDRKAPVEKINKTNEKTNKTKPTEKKTKEVQ